MARARRTACRTAHPWMPRDGGPSATDRRRRRCPARGQNASRRPARPKRGRRELCALRCITSSARDVFQHRGLTNVLCEECDQKALTLCLCRPRRTLEHELQEFQVDPLAKLVADLPNVCDFDETEALVQPHA